MNKRHANIPLVSSYPSSCSCLKACLKGKWSPLKFNMDGQMMVLLLLHAIQKQLHFSWPLCSTLVSQVPELDLLRKESLLCVRLLQSTTVPPLKGSALLYKSCLGFAVSAAFFNQLANFLFFGGKRGEESDFLVPILTDDCLQICNKLDRMSDLRWSLEPKDNVKP